VTGSLMQTVTRVVDRGLKTNSYKLALLRSLVAIAGRSRCAAPLRITRIDLAEQFVERYWRLALLFHVRQATVPDKDPVVMRLIRAEQARLRFSDETTVQDYQRRSPVDYKRLIASVANEAFHDVVPRFHTVHKREVEPRLYKPDGHDVIVEKPAYEFLRENARTVDLLAIAGWVAFTEQFTSAPKLFEKIEGTAARRKQLAPYRAFLGVTVGFACFYCRAPAPQNTPVDHVIPWAFVAEDKVWNLVLACASCNGQKSSSVASMEYIRRLSDRNERLMAESSETLPSFISRELAEWRVRSLRDHVSLLAERCRLDGFAEWRPQCQGRIEQD
jgi:5-methylcytosine-specific restriction endonuclease McrA